MLRPLYVFANVLAAGEIIQEGNWLKFIRYVDILTLFKGYGATEAALYTA